MGLAHCAMLQRPLMPRLRMYMLWVSMALVRRASVGASTSWLDLARWGGRRWWRVLEWDVAVMSAR